MITDLSCLGFVSPDIPIHPHTLLTRYATGFGVSGPKKSIVWGSGGHFMLCSPGTVPDHCCVGSIDVSLKD